MRAAFVSERAHRSRHRAGRLGLLRAGPGAFAMTGVERQELAEAMARIESRFEHMDRAAATLREDIDAIRDDISRIKGMARLVAVLLPVGATLTVGIIGLMLR